MELQVLILNLLRKFYKKEPFAVFNGYVNYFGQEANDFMFQRLQEGKPIMAAKFGTVELGVVEAFETREHIRVREYFQDYMKGKISLYNKEVLKGLCSNAGFFPNDINLGEKYFHLMKEDMKEIDILCSYIYGEKCVSGYLDCKRVDLDGFYAPFMWKNPWTKILKDKKVLVVHPFVDSIRYQYENNLLCGDVRTNKC